MHIKGVKTSINERANGWGIYITIDLDIKIKLKKEIKFYFLINQRPSPINIHCYRIDHPRDPR